MTRQLPSIAQSAPAGRSPAIAVLVPVLVVAMCVVAARADGPSAEGLARGLADEVLEKAQGADPDGLRVWTHEVIERALERATEGGSEIAGDVGTSSDAPAPLPGERHAGALADPHPNTAEVLVFMSLSVPATSWRAWAAEAARVDAPLVLRGAGAQGFRETVMAVGDRLGAARAGVAIDPRLFRLFGVDRVPAVAVVPGGVAPCRNRGCAGDPAPAHDLVFGNTGLAGALETVASEGGAARGVARRTLERLRGEP